MRDHTVYMQFEGRMVRVAEPKGSPDRPNFVITYKDRDWSGFRTLAEAEAQFPQLAGRPDDPFAVVER